MRRIIPAFSAILLALVFLLSGCMPGASSAPRTSSEGTGTASAAPASGTAAPSGTQAPSGAPASGQPSAAPADAPVDCDWTMFVEQTIPKTVDGLTINYELMLVAQKSGGKDVNGTYKGVAYVGVNFDASQMNSDVLKMLGGFNVNACTYDLTFDVVGFDNEKYSEYGLEGDLPPLAQLVQYQSMALVTPQMTGTGTLDTSITGIQGEHGGTSDSNSGSTSVAMRMTVDSGKVTVDIPSFQLTHKFEGMVTGVPIGGSPDDQIQQAADQIKTLMDQAEAESEEAAAASGADLGSLMEQFKP
jgi:hypothetical protein